MADCESARKEQKPSASPEQCAAIALDLWGLQCIPGAAKGLDSYDDHNCYLKGTLPGCPEGQKPMGYMLKIHNGVDADRPSLVEAGNSIATFLHESGFTVPLPLPTKVGEYVGYTVLDTGRRHPVRLLSWVDGTPLCVAGSTAGTRAQLGNLIGRISVALESFTHPALKRETMWDLLSTPALRSFLNHIDDLQDGRSRRKLVEAVISAYETTVSKRLEDPGVRWGVIHGDFNDGNAIVDANGTITGIIDFGDAVHSLKVCDLAVAMAYAMVTKDGVTKPVNAAAEVYRSASKVFPLNPNERSLLRVLVASRLAMSCTLGALASAKDPTNEYLSLHAQPAWTALEVFWATPEVEVEAEFDRDAPASV